MVLINAPSLCCLFMQGYLFYHCFNGPRTLKTYTPILARLGPESVVKSVDSSTEAADSATDSVIVGRLSVSNIFNILNALESANGNQPTIAVGQREMGLVGTGL